MSKLETLCYLAFAALVGCGDNGANNDPGDGTSESVYATASIVFSDDGQNTYLSLLSNLDTQQVSIDNAIELPGWSDLGAFDGKLYVADGEAPTMRRYDVAADHTLTPEGSVSFINYGAEYAGSAFLTASKAYLFAETGVVWNPAAMEVSTTFDLPPAPAAPADGYDYSGFTSGRAFAARGNRAYVATSWANWNDYTVAEDSLIVVFDTDTHTIVKTITVPCPYIDVATLADDGTIYFSNWVYSIGQTLVQGKRHACAVRILPGQDTIDPAWSLTFADVTQGREGAALQYLGDGKALFSVYHHERVDDLASQTDFSMLTDAANWRFWVIDLETRAAQPVEEIDFNAGGFYTSRIDGRLFVLVPNGDYTGTTIYEMVDGGSATQRWTVDGWSLQLVKVR